MGGVLHQLEGEIAALRDFNPVYDRCGRHKPFSYFRIILVWLPNSTEQLEYTRSVETAGVRDGLSPMKVHCYQACFDGMPPVASRGSGIVRYPNRWSRVRGAGAGSLPLRIISRPDAVT